MTYDGREQLVAAEGSTKAVVTALVNITRPPTRICTPPHPEEDQKKGQGSSAAELSGF
ncbi:hypothetical protein [Micromonospora sp. WMMD737]|uniref:hypothetical protein n=1 Tax=Micromonospora sp. WMMD737 TaxID=3404113 RepID=UPI003B950572